MEKIEIGTKVYTERFCTVTIDTMFSDPKEAAECGYTEPTYTSVDGWDIKGKSLDCYHMIFAAVKK